MPTVSVVIPAFNVKRYIAQSMRSVLAQTYRDFELLVIDDGSTDETATIARRFKDPRIRVITQRNRGLAGARNAGIRAAIGRYVAFLDADDLWLPNKLALHVEHLDTQPEVGVSYSVSSFIDDHGAPMRLMQVPKLRDVMPSDVFTRNPIGNGSAPVIRMATLDAIAFQAQGSSAQEWCYFDERFRQSEDIECWMRIALTTGWRFEGLAEPLTLYRVNDTGLSANVDKQLASWEQMVRCAAEHDAAFVGRWVRAARGYQLRYLARRAVRAGDARRAVGLMAAALRSNPGMLTREPVRTLVTLGAAALRACLPERVYAVAEGWAMRSAATLQRLRLYRLRGPEPQSAR